MISVVVNTTYKSSVDGDAATMLRVCASQRKERKKRMVLFLGVQVNVSSLLV